MKMVQEHERAKYISLGLGSRYETIKSFQSSEMKIVPTGKYQRLNNNKPLCAVLHNTGRAKDTYCLLWEDGEITQFDFTREHNCYFWVLKIITSK